MLRPIPAAIGLRYLRAKRRNGFISFISLASIFAIAIGVTVLITTLAVMSGFQKEIRDRMLGMVAHATISADGDTLQNWARAIDVAREDPRVAGAAPYVDTQALLRGRRNEPAAVRAISPDDEVQVSELGTSMVVGELADLQPGSFNIVLGRELALWLGVVQHHLGAMLAGQAFANAPVAAVHALAYPLGGHYHVPHGLSNALMLGPVLRFNARAAAPLYAELDTVLNGPGAGGAEERALHFVDSMQRLMDGSGAPRRLRDVGVTDNSLAMLAADAMKQTRLLVNNPVEVTEADALALYREAF